MSRKDKNCFLIFFKFYKGDRKSAKSSLSAYIAFLSNRSTRQRLHQIACYSDCLQNDVLNFQLKQYAYDKNSIYMYIYFKRQFRKKNRNDNDALYLFLH